MTIHEFKQQLETHRDRSLAFQLPDGGFIPAHFHITEVGHVGKTFVDCGGTRRTQETCLLQTWVANDEGHRLPAGKLADIFAKTRDVLPDHGLPVEIEFEDCVVAQFPVQSASVIDGALTFQLGLKHTDCLAKEVCLPNGCCGSGETACCA
jgi:Family of unknown function (DUF6428)